MQTVDLAKLRTGHPRLIVLDSELERVKALATTDPNATRYRENLTAAGEKLLADPKTVEYKLIGPRLLDQSRKCLARIYTLAALWRRSGASMATRSGSSGRKKSSLPPPLFLTGTRRTFSMSPR